MRFLIAETESGYTLLAALWLARLFGIERNIEISPLFETAEALESGARVLEEALRSPHWRDYLQSTGRLCLQFGYSDSGRYVGPARRDLSGRAAPAQDRRDAVAVRGHGRRGRPVRHAWREYRARRASRLSRRAPAVSLPAVSRQALKRANLPVREESAFQGGDGYLLFGTPELALATVARDRRAHLPSGGGPDRGSDLCRPGFRRRFLRHHRPAWRRWSRMPATPRSWAHSARRCWIRPARAGGAAVGGMGERRARSAIRSELRAIPNNAILQQLGWCANTLQGLGAAAARHPETFPDMRATPRGSAGRSTWRRTRCAFRHRRAARGDRDARSRDLAGPRRAHDAAGAARGAGLGRARAGAARHLGAGAVDVPPHPGRSPGVAGRLAGCAADGDARGAAARAAAGADPPNLAAGHRDPGFLARATASRGRIWRRRCCASKFRRRSG